MQYLVNEHEYLAIVNDEFSLDDVPIIAKKFENGTFSNILSRSTCKTTCNTVNVNCTTEYNHAPGETCNAAPDQQAYTYISCSTFCYVDVSISDEDSPGGGNGGSGGGGGSNANTIPFPMEPCQTGGSGSGHTGPNTGINDGNGMCVVPWVAAMNSQLKLTQAELRVLRDYPELIDLFGYYFDVMGNNADTGLVRSLINHIILNNNGTDFVYDSIYYLIDNPNISSKKFHNWFLNKQTIIEPNLNLNPNLITYGVPIQQTSLPSFNSFLNNFPKLGTTGNYYEMPTSNVYQLVGGSLWISHQNTPKAYSNACSIRGSRALLYSNIEIPVLNYPNVGQRTQKGGDNKNYILDAVSFNKFMIDKFGDTSYKLEDADANDVTKVADLLEGKNGIYVIVNQSHGQAGYSGHVDAIIDGICISNAYTTPKGGVKSIRIWVLN